MSNEDKSPRRSGAWIGNEDLKAIFTPPASDARLYKQLEDALHHLLNPTKRGMPSSKTIDWKSFIAELGPKTTLIVQAYQQGNYGEAKTLASQILGKLSPEQHLHALKAEAASEQHAGPVTTATFWLARIDDILSNTKEADSLFRLLVTVYERFAGQDALSTAQWRHSYGVFLWASCRDPQRARKYFDEVIATLDGNPAANEEMLAKALSSVGDICVKEGKYTEANRYLQRALSIEEELLRQGRSWTGMTVTLQVLAELSAAQNEHQKTKEYLERAIDLFHRHFDFRTRKAHDWANLLLRLADCYGRLGMNAECLDKAEGALEAASDVFGAESERMIYFLCTAGTLYESFGNRTQATKRARELYEQAIRLSRQHAPNKGSQGADSEAFAKCCNALACSYFKTQEWAKAEAWLKEAVRCYEEPTCQAGQELIDALTLLADTYEHLGKSAEASECRKKSAQIKRTLSDNGAD